MFKDTIEIEQLLYRCCHAVDCGELEKIMGLFHPEATLRIMWEENGTHVGHDAIRAWFMAYIHTVRETLRLLRHKIDSPMIEVMGEDAVARCYLTVEAAHKESEQRIVTLGRYEDKLCKRENRWLFQEKAIFMDDVYRV